MSDRTFMTIAHDFDATAPMDNVELLNMCETVAKQIACNESPDDSYSAFGSIVSGDVLWWSSMKMVNGYIAKRHHVVTHMCNHIPYGTSIMRTATDGVFAPYNINTLYEGYGTFLYYLLREMDKCKSDEDMENVIVFFESALQFCTTYARSFMRARYTR